jgi:dipeptidyl aminopeptidase/acylaminoacyl peptidase
MFIAKRLKWRIFLGGVIAIVLSLGHFGFAMAAQTKHRVTFDDLQSLKAAEFIELSPDGKNLAYVLQEEIWLVETRPGSQPRKIAKGLLPHWSPDSRKLAFYSRQSGSLQLWVLEIDSGEVQRLTDIEGGVDPDPWTALSGSFYDSLRTSWSPDGTKLAFCSRVKSKNAAAGPASPSPTGTDSAELATAPLVLTNTTPPEWTLSGIFIGRKLDRGAPWKKGEMSSGTQIAPPKMVNQIFVVNVLDKKLEQLTEDDGIYFTPDWGHDGKTLLCASSEGKEMLGYGFGTTNIYVINLVTRKKTALTTGGGEKMVPTWSPDGRQIAFMGGEHFGMPSVFVVSSEGGKISEVTAKLKRYVMDFKWAGNSNSIWVSCRDGLNWPIMRFDMATGDFSQKAGFRGEFHWQLTASDRGMLAWQESDGSTFGVIRILQPGSDSSYVLLDLNPQIREWELGAQEVVSWKNRRGDDLQGVLVKPVGYQEGRKYPLIVDAYPGWTNQFRGYPMSMNQAMASKGYLLFWPASRAPHVWMNYLTTAEFSNAAKGPQGWDVTVDDILSGMDELIQEGMVDTNRVGLYGFSNGGGVANYLVTRTSRFKCAVSGSPALTDYVRPALLNTADPMIQSFAGGKTLWEDPDGYIQLSAVFHLDKVTTPMLLADGDNAGDFLLDSIEMYNGLRWFGKEVTLLRYPGQAHGFTGAALRDFWERENAFFDHYLKPDQLPN